MAAAGNLFGLPPGSGEPVALEKSLQFGMKLQADLT
jgi:hypothetical protein